MPEWNYDGKKLPTMEVIRESEREKRLILIVDDDPTMLRIMRAFLQDDYRVTMVSSGKDAIEFLIHNQPDAILLDYVMPLFNGPSVLKIIRSKEKTRHIPVFFLTGQKDRDTVIECLSLNPAGYFVKPIEKDTLLEKLNSYFNKRA